MTDGTPLFEPGPEHPVIVTEAEWKGLQKRGTWECKHDWLYRMGKSDIVLIIVHNTSMERKPLPSGRVCQICGKVEFKDHHHKYAMRWEQNDFTPKS